jgi:Flp pilus assembly protein TadG
MRTRCGERGGALVEVVIFLPVLLLALLAGLQLAFVATSDLSAQNAARAGARAASKGQDGYGAAMESVAGWLRPRTSVRVSTDSDAATVEVTVEAPRLFPGLPRRTLVRSHEAVLPTERTAPWG